MKKKFTIISLLLATSLFANDAMRSEVELTAGYNHFDSASLLENATLFGIRGTMYETEVNKYGLQLGYEGTGGISYENRDPAKETSLHRLFTHLVVDGEEEYHVTPYLFLGGGYEYLSDEIKGEPSQGFVDLGVGFKYHFSNGFHVGVEGKGIGKFDTRDLGYNLSLTMGYTLGNLYSHKQEPLHAFEDKHKVKEGAPKKDLHRRIDIIKVQADKRYEPMQIVEKKEEISPVMIEPQTVSTYESISEDNLIIEDAFYVQMAAYKSTPVQPLIDRLLEKGYTNTELYPKGELNTVIVGPYDTKIQAKEALKSLKMIKKDAFITTIQE